MFEYNYFLRRYGVRLPAQLTSPVLAKTEELDFPKGSVFHYTTDNLNEVGPASDEFMFRNITKPIMLDHIIEAGDNKGNPRRLPIQSEPLIRLHRVKNNRYRPLRDIVSSSKDTFTLIVYSYSLIARNYRYTRSLYTDYFRWWNYESAIWKNIGKVAGLISRHQFIKLKLPLVLPSVANLRIGEGDLNQRIIKTFDTPESRMILEIWKWLGDNKKESLLSNIPDDKLDTVNIIFEESGKWTFINLGLLHSWRKPNKEELEANPELKEKGIDSDQLQKRFLKLLMIISEARTVTITEKDIIKQNKEGIRTELTKQENLINDNLTKINIANNTFIDSDLPNDETYHEVNMAELDKDLAMLDEINEQVEETNSESDDKNELLPINDIFAISEDDSLESNIKVLCNKLAEKGLISAAEYRRHMKLSESYKTLKAPDGKSTLEEYIKLPFSELAIHESKTIPDISTVTDKSMLKSSLLDFDKRYITEILEKDIAGMVLNIQKAGISVIDYNVEHIDDVMGAYKDYTLRIQPVEGAVSTLKFSIPVVNEDGYYVANGIKYLLRKQISDLPIRKIAPDIVALTSYYGKIFVSRSDKKVFDYGNWLCNQIMMIGLDIENNTVSNLQPGNSFDNLFECPRIYSILGKRFKSFNVNVEDPLKKGNDSVYSFNFDRKDILDNFSKDELTKYEKDGSIIVGRINNNEYLVLDKNNTFYRGFDNNLYVLGTIEQLVKLDIVKAPKEFAELKVLGKNIPIGLILAHEVGLHNLIKSLKIDYRKVQVGTRTILLDNEYALVFDDETLIFSRDDELATLILSGFLEYKDIIKTYSIYEFDRKDVYLNILESKNITIRYLREIETLYQLFIDPITKEILEEMKEPLTFRGLLLRSCELLLSETHPDEIDPVFMRKKGYERFAGTVYSELVRSIRIHKGRIERSRAAIELNPHSIWMNISQDPSKILVSEINPIQNLKEIESVTFGGTGGRSERSMVKHTRIYHPNDMGTISEATVDSKDVGFNTYTSANPKFTSLRGLSKKFDINVDGPTSLLSTSALLAPSSDHDD